MPSALITGITGQDGAYLARLLLGRGYRVWGAVRDGAEPALPSLHALGIRGAVEVVQIDLADFGAVHRAVEAAAPDEIYNLAAQSSVAASFQTPLETGDITGLGTARLLQAVRAVQPQARFFQASSAEMFGPAGGAPCSEETPFAPRNPYAVAKLYAHWMTVAYREAWGCHAGCGILFSHESPLRPQTFVTRKIATGVARIKHGLQDSLALGNLDVQRDWGFAGDYVEAMWRMLQRNQPDDYVIATGRIHSLREFVDLAFRCVGLNYHDYVRQDPALFRPIETPAIVGDPDKARRRLGWTSRVSFEQLVALLVEAELKRVRGDEAGIRYYLENP